MGDIPVWGLRLEPATRTPANDSRQHIFLSEERWQRMFWDPILHLEPALLIRLMEAPIRHLSTLKLAYEDSLCVYWAQETTLFRADDPSRELVKIFVTPEKITDLGVHSTLTIADGVDRTVSFSDIKTLTKGWERLVCKYFFNDGERLNTL